MATIDELKKVRLEKLEKLKEAGVDPYPAVVRRGHSVAQARSLHDQAVSVAGRILGKRGHGKIFFLDLMDESGKIQVVLKADVCNKDAFEKAELLDMADFISVQGEVGATQAGEVSIFAKDFQIITKTVRPLPDTWHGLKDVEERYRKRYLDTILNEDVKKRFITRSVTIDAIRDFLTTRKFLEVETPTLQPVYGGGFARPFVTHHKVLDADFYLRISDEMYLKRLIVGGFDKVFEITKVFRNEGVDHDHNPEFTMFEAQIAYEDYSYGMDLIEEVTEYAAKQALGTTKAQYQGDDIDFKRPWKRLRMVEAVREFTGIDPLTWKDVAQAKQAILAMGIPEESLKHMDSMRSVGELIAFAFEETVEGKLIQPTIIYDYPIEVSPLAKKCKDPRFTQRFEQFAAGFELGNNYTELNDPVDLKRRFLEEKKREEAGFEEAHQTDDDYLEAIEHGFPPTCGIAIGIDRFVMILTNAHSIKEVIPFPTLRPETRITVKKAVTIQTGSTITLNTSFSDTYPTAAVGYAVIANITVKKKDNNLEKEKSEVLESYKGIKLDTIEAYPEIKSYRQMYKKMGVDLHSRRPSPEALLRRVVQGKGLYTVNTCVDAYNLIVMKHRVSLGAFDFDHMKLPIEVKVAKGGETIDLLGVDGVTELVKGEVIYEDQAGPFNLDYNYRDAERTKITEKTKNIVINVDGVYDIDEKSVARSLEEAITIITKYCGGEVVDAGIVTADGRSLKLKGFESKQNLRTFDYRERKIVAIVNSELDKGKVSNALGNMAVSAGRYLDDSWMGEPILKDANGISHRGISKHPFIVLGATTKQIKDIIHQAKKQGIFSVDYPQEMFDTGTDENLSKALAKAKENNMVYHAVLLAGKSEELKELTGGLSLYK